MPTVTVDPSAPAPALLDRAAALLRAGGLVAFPTETVYGLGADAFDATAVQQIFTVKGRPADNPVIVHISTPGDLHRVAGTVTPLARELADRWWPGPLTIVVDAHPDLPQVTTGGLRTVAIRLPDHPVARALIAAAGVPIAAPSANRSGRPSPTTAAHVLHDLGDRIDLVIDGGPCRVGLESTVVDARGSAPVVLREGSITREDLGVRQRGVAGPDGAVAPDLTASPGTRHRHYQPRCRVLLAAPGEGGRAAQRAAQDGSRVGLVAPVEAPDGIRLVARFRDAQDLAVRLYAALRAAEDAGVDILVVEGVPATGIGAAVMDRLQRAAGEG